MHRAEHLAIPGHLGLVLVAFFAGFKIDHVPDLIEAHHSIRPPQLTVSKVNGTLREHFRGVRLKKPLGIVPVEDGFYQGCDGSALIWGPQIGALYTLLQVRPIRCVLQLTQQSVNGVAVLYGSPLTFRSKRSPMQLGACNALTVRLA